MYQISSGIKHYALITNAIAKAKDRDRNFVFSYFESREISLQFEWNVRYTMTCTMDTILMKLFTLCHQKNITLNALKKDASPLKQIVKLIDSGDHVKAR